MTVLLLLLSAYAQAQCDSLSFELRKQDVTCKNNNGAIMVINQKGTGPFTYTLLPNNIQNTKGVFENLASGTYAIIVRDACNNEKARTVTLTLPVAVDFTFSINTLANPCLQGQANITPAGAGTYAYGYSYTQGTNITWSNSPNFTFPLQLSNLWLYMKDSCGNVQEKATYINQGYIPHITDISHILKCGRWDLFVGTSGFTNPTYCLYKADRSLYACQTSPNFLDIPYDNYYCIVSDGCFRDSLYKQNKESVGGQKLDVYDLQCNAFTIHVRGVQDTVCLYDATTGQSTCLVQDRTSINPATGLSWPNGAVFTNLQYGHYYYAWNYDDCSATTYRMDTVVANPYTVSIASIPGCEVGASQVVVNFSSTAKPPYLIRVYYPNGSLAASVTTNNINSNIQFPSYPGGGTLTIIGQDNCGNADTTYQVQQTFQIYKTVSVTQKCPGLFGNSGSGDVVIRTAVDDIGIVPTPQIIKYNGRDTTIAHSSYTYPAPWHQFTLPNLLSGTYIIQYNLNRCNSKIVYDTITIKEYAYPQQMGTIVQCDKNFVSFRDNILNGVAPYTWEVLAPTRQTSNDKDITIATNDTIKNVTVKVIDACGNSDIRTFSVQQVPTCWPLDLDTTTRKFVRLEDKLIKVYPNPSRGTFAVAFSQKTKSDYLVSIFNEVGLKVSETRLLNVDQKEHMVSGLLRGAYIVRIINERTNQISTFKQIVF